MCGLILPVEMTFFMRILVLIAILASISLAFLIANNKYCLVIAKVIAEIITVIVLAMIVPQIFIWIFR